MAGARVRPIFSNFSSGEWSSRLDGRVDLEGYASACKRLENFILHQQGGATGRYGTHYICPVKDQAALTRLIPFRFSTDQAYIIEAGNNYFRFYKDRGRIEVAGVPVEIATTYTTARLPEVHYCQNADTMFLTHQDIYPQNLVRYSHTIWKIRNVPFKVLPSYEYGGRPNATLTPSAVTGAGVTLTASANSFEVADIGRIVEVTGGASIGARATITAYTSQLIVTATVLDDFADLNPTAAGSWKIGASPRTTLSMVTATGSVRPTPGATITCGLTSAGFRNLAGATDVGKFIRAYGGTVQLTAFVSATSMTGILRSEFDVDPLDDSGGYLPLAAEAWTLEEAAWSALNGYPRTVSWFDGRLLYGSTRAQPRTWWMSAAGDPYTFALGSLDDDAMAWTVDSREVNTIRWLVPDSKLLIGTAGSEHTASGGNETPITPSNPPLVRPAGRRGSGSVMPAQTSDAVLFLTASGKKLHALAYAFDADRYRSSDTLIQAEHLTRGRLTYQITDLAYQSEPDGIIWAVRNDGVLLGLTLLRSQVGWHRHITDGAFEAVACIPATDGTYDELWAIVRRTVGGATKRYVEWMDQSWDVYSGEAPGVRTDSCLTYTGGAVNTVSGLSHLIGKTVKIVGNGSPYPDAVVNGAGEVTLVGPAATSIEVGLGFTPVLRPMRPEVPLAGSSQGVAKSWGPVTIRLHTTLGCVINGDEIPWRSSADPMGAHPALFTGDKRLTPPGGWSTDGYLEITQPQPLPITILCLAGTLLVTD